MTRLYVGPIPLVALGTVGELELLDAFDGDPVVPARVRQEVSTEPAATNLDRFLDGRAADPGYGSDDEDLALRVLGDAEPSSDSAVLAGVLARMDDGDAAIGVVSDDRRLRRIADGLGATVTGTFGVVVRATIADEYLSADQAKRIVRRIDSHGLHLTGELREQALGGAGA